MGPIKAKAKIVKAKTTTLIAINAEFIQVAAIETVIIIKADIAAPSTQAIVNYSTAATTISISAI